MKKVKLTLPMNWQLRRCLYYHYYFVDQTPAATVLGHVQMLINAYLGFAKDLIIRI